MNTLLTAIREFYRIGFIRPAGLINWIKVLRKYGKNLLSIIAYHESLRPNKLALQDDEHAWTYSELFQNLLAIRNYLVDKNIDKKKRVAIISHNNASMIQLLFACSSLGNDIVLLNADNSLQQVEKVIEEKKFDVVFVDKNWSKIFNHSDYISLESIEECLLLSKKSNRTSFMKYPTGNVVVMSGGSSGHVKFAERKPSVTAFLHPFIALLHTIKLPLHQSLFLSIPVYHGFGLASLIVTFILGKTVYISQNKSPEKIISFLNQNRIDVIALVPTILTKLLQHDSTATSLRCIISGGAHLPISTLQETEKRYGAIVYNLYGTSEAGFCAIASPEDLKNYPETIGKIIKGVKYKIMPLDSANERKGILHIHCNWMMKQHEKWVTTGDIIEMNEENFLFLQGRKDTMIVCGGENVFPEEIEKICLLHPSIDDIAIIAKEDKLYGHIFIAMVVSTNTEEEITKWMKSNLARYQLPKEVILVERLPYYENGKLNKNSLMMDYILKDK